MVPEDVVERATFETARDHFIQLSSEGIWCFEFDPPVSLQLGMDACIAECLSRGRMAQCNDALARMYGYERATELRGLPLAGFMGEGPDNLEYLRAFYRAGLRLDDAESREVDRNGEPRTFLNNMVGVTSGELLVRVWGTQRDITQSRRLEDQLRQVQKMEALGQLAGGIAHDLNNMLTVILGNVDLARDSAPRELGSSLEAVRRAADQASALTRKLLRFSERHPLTLEVLELGAAVEDTVAMLRRVIPESIELVIDLAPGLPPIMADRVEIEQVLVNLAVNARDAITQHGAIRIATRLGPAPAGSAPHFVVLEVADTGRGIAAKDLPHIFEPFYTTKASGCGTGLGLAVVHDVATKLGASISVESRVGRGSRFTLHIPVAEQKPAAPRVSVESAPELCGATILLVEDQHEVRRLTRRFLELHGHWVLDLDDPRRALEVASVHAGRIDLLLADVVMPCMSGVELAFALARSRPGLRVLFMSGHSDLASAAQVETLRGMQLVTKPFSQRDLARAVANALQAAPFGL